MGPQITNQLHLTRRDFFGSAGLGLGAAALATLLDRPRASAAETSGGLPELPHFAPKAKRVIFLFMEGGPSHLDLFDPKPELERLAGQPMSQISG